MNLFDLGQDILKFREVIDTVEVKGISNATRIVYCANLCDKWIKAINDGAALNDAVNEAHSTVDHSNAAASFASSDAHET